MPTYGYTSISPSAFFSGVKGNSTLYASTLGNHNFLGVETRPPGITSYLGPIGGDGAAVTSTGYVDVARFYFPGNTDNRDVAFTFAAVAVGGTGTIRATIDGTDTGTVSVTSANTYSIVITPTTSTDPSEVLIEGLVSAGQMNITNMGAQLRQVDVDLGEASSGFTYLDGSTYTATGAPHVSEVWERMANGPRQLTADRRAVVVNLADQLGAASARSPYAADGTTPETVARFWYPGVDAAPREYTLAQYWQADGGVSFSATVNIGSELVTTTAAGWTTSTLTLPPTGLEGSAKVKITAGSGYAYLRALQLFRKV
jgi:hypothetical protein